MSRRLVQIAPGVNPGDAITNEIGILAEFCRTDPEARAWFAESLVYAEHIGPDVGFPVTEAHRYRPRAGDRVVYHYGIAAHISADVWNWPAPRVLVYHNVTPASFFTPYDLRVAGRLTRARAELRTLRDAFGLCLADSHFNAAELTALGFERVVVLPVLFEGGKFGPGVPPARRVQRAPTVLFVGRVAPNKGHRDLTKLFYYLRSLVPDARLVLCGAVSSGADGYFEELRRLVRALGLEDAVRFTGYVSDAQLTAHYASADLFLCASAHEGFCVPLLEAMRADVPVLAWSGGGAVAETMAGAGVLFDVFDYPRVAALAAELMTDQSLRERVLVKQRERLAACPSTEDICRDFLFHLRQPGTG